MILGFHDDVGDRRAIRVVALDAEFADALLVTTNDLNNSFRCVVTDLAATKDVAADGCRLLQEIHDLVPLSRLLGNQHRNRAGSDVDGAQQLRFGGIVRAGLAGGRHEWFGWNGVAQG